jgi:hypothetical protein
MSDTGTNASKQGESEKEYDAETLFGDRAKYYENLTNFKLKYTKADGSRVL